MIPLGIAGWVASAAARGHLSAHFDAERGQYTILSYGFPTPWRAEYARLLKERYRIEHRVVAGCVVSQSLVDFVDAYDSVIEQEANRRYGHNIFKEASDEVMKNYNTGRHAATIR